MTRIPHRHPSPAPALPATLLGTVLVLAVVLAVAPCASATTYIVELVNGTTFETRYQPEEASWDDSVLMLLTQYGNWIALSKDDVVDVTTDVEARGFGKVIDTKTISLGILANDAVPPEEQEPPTQAEVMRDLLQQQQQNQPDYSVQQFVDPVSAGGGLPVGYTQQQQPAPPLLINQQ